MENDHFKLAYRGFRGLMWVLFIIVMLAAITFVSESYGGRPSLATTLLLIQVSIEFLLCLVTARLFKNKAPRAVPAGYATLVLITVLSIFFYGASLRSVVGLLLAAVVIYLFVIVFKTSRELSH